MELCDFCWGHHLHERLIKPSRSQFPPKFSPGQLRGGGGPHFHAFMAELWERGRRREVRPPQNFHTSIFFSILLIIVIIERLECPSQGAMKDRQLCLSVLFSNDNKALIAHRIWKGANEKRFQEISRRQHLWASPSSTSAVTIGQNNTAASSRSRTEKGHHIITFHHKQSSRV